MLTNHIRNLVRSRARKLGSIRTVIFSLMRKRTLGASVIAIDDDGKVVLIENSYGSKAWKLPGGGVKRNESFELSASREISEEAGIELDKGSELKLRSIHHQRLGRWDNYVAVYEVRGWSQRSVDTWEVTSVGRFDPNDLPASTAPGHRRRIEEWLGKRPVSSDW
jgi:8-oxo-dGTP pyrophosphatase MutT (NUDIX family)